MGRTGGFESPQPPFNSHHRSPVMATQIPSSEDFQKIPLPWRGAENSLNFRWGGLREIAGFAASSGRWLRLRSVTGRRSVRIGGFAYGYVINHPVVNSVGIYATPPQDGNGKQSL